MAMNSPEVAAQVPRVVTKKTVKDLVQNLRIIKGQKLLSGAFPEATARNEQGKNYKKMFAIVIYCVQIWKL